MSEFSESFHVYGATRESVRSLLRAADAGGAIVSNDRSVSFVLADPSKEDNVIAQSPGVVCRYEYGEDHGVWFRFYRSGGLLGTLSVRWGPNFGSDDPDAQPGVSLPTALLEDLVRLGVLNKERSTGVEQMVVACRGKDIADGESVAGDLAALFGFAAYRRLSTETLLSGGGIDDLARLYPNAEEVELS